MFPEHNATRAFIDVMMQELAHSTAARRLRHKKARYMQSRGQLAFERPLNVSCTHDREEEENVIMQSLLDEAVLDVARYVQSCPTSLAARCR
ncbi:MAG: hypothetical protein EOO41_03315 [Methanobacteriota archaeon]|nr:MAG: hypothetical protein EOO41_03315 [Euryarchaeota archaeon]